MDILAELACKVQCEECGEVIEASMLVRVDSPASRLCRGEAVPGQQGACIRDGCAHSRPWHSRYARHRCEQCGCPRYIDSRWPDK